MRSLWACKPLSRAATRSVTPVTAPWISPRTTSLMASRPGSGTPRLRRGESCAIGSPLPLPAMFSATGGGRTETCRGNSTPVGPPITSRGCSGSPESTGRPRFTSGSVAQQGPRQQRWAGTTQRSGRRRSAIAAEERKEWSDESNPSVLDQGGPKRAERVNQGEVDPSCP